MPPERAGGGSLDRSAPRAQAACRARQVGTRSTTARGDLVDFVENGLYDERIANLCALIPQTVPSGATISTFQGCP